MSKKRYEVIRFPNGSTLHVDLVGARVTSAEPNIQNLPKDEDQGLVGEPVFVCPTFPPHEGDSE